jgi:hypothetical protein
MGVRQDCLESILCAKYGRGAHQKPQQYRLYNSNLFSDINDTYNKLGGVLELPPLKTGPYDIDTNDIIFELDEEQHFNRYRLITLESTIYKSNKRLNVIDYRRFCRDYEYACERKANYGKYWKNSSTEKQFGRSSDNGILTGNGSSRWKQRAFYDYLKDVFSIITGVPIIRVSVYETYKDKTVNDLISRHNERDLLEFIQNKVDAL